MPGPRRGPFGLAIPVSLVSAQLPAHLASAELRGVDVGVGQAVEDHFYELVELVNAIQGGRNPLPGGSDDVRRGEHAGNCRRGGRTSLWLRELGRRHVWRVAAQEYGDETVDATLANVDMGLRRRSLEAFVAQLIGNRLIGAIDRGLETAACDGRNRRYFLCRNHVRGYADRAMAVVAGGYPQGQQRGRCAQHRHE